MPRLTHHACLRTGVCMCVCDAICWSRKETVLNLEFDERTDAGLRKLVSTHRRRYSFDGRKKKEKKKEKKTSLHEFTLSDRDNGKKKPTENNLKSIFHLFFSFDFT